MHLSNRQLFLRHVAQTSPSPLLLEVDRAEGIYLYDPEGKAYLDLIAGISVSSLGHCHPAVVAAIEQQARRYLHTLVYGELVLSPQVKLAEALAEVLPAPLRSVYFVNSGAEATEGAMKLAKRATGRRRFVAFERAYHGSTQGALSLMSEPYFTEAFAPLLPEVAHIPFNNAASLQSIDTQTAAVVVETVQAEAGVVLPTFGFLKKLRRRCDEVGALLILDEIQVGFGRTGTLFAFEQYGIVPDILLLAKAMGGGMPIGAFVASAALMQNLSRQPVLGHITTFGGHPVSCAAALATLQTLQGTQIYRTVGEKSALFAELLVHPAISEVRRSGLLMAVELPDFAFVQAVIGRCLVLGLLTDWFLFNDRCLRIAPPLVITLDEVRRACAVLLEAIEFVHCQH